MASTVKIQPAHTFMHMRAIACLKRTQFCCLVCGLPAPWKLLPSPKETIAIWLVELSYATVTKSLTEAVANPPWVVNNSNNIWYVLFF